MPLTDAALSQQVLYAFMVGFLDIADMPIRAALSHSSVAVPEGMTGDADFDDQIFDALDPTFLSVGTIGHDEGGSETVKIRLAATIAGDAEVLNALADRAKFQGRRATFWIGLRDAAGAIAEMRHLHTGYMSVPEISCEPDEQIITLRSENYLNIISGGAPKRSLLAQRDYDPDDASADAVAGAANSTAPSGLTPSGGNGAEMARTAREFATRIA